MFSVACPSVSRSLTNTHSSINPVRTDQCSLTHSGLSVHVLSMYSCDFSTCTELVLMIFLLHADTIISISVNVVFLHHVFHRFSSWGFILIHIYLLWRIVIWFLGCFHWHGSKSSSNNNCKAIKLTSFISKFPWFESRVDFTKWSAGGQINSKDIQFLEKEDNHA